MSFKLGECKKIGIYGYTKRAKRIKAFLMKNEFKEVFFIDRNVQDASVDAVYTFHDMIANNTEDLEGVAVIISLQNAMMHQKLAEKIYNAGIEKIIFLPIGVSCRVRTAAYMRKFYNNLINENVSMETSFPRFSEIVVNEKVQNINGIICQDEKYTTFWMHVNNVYVNDASDNVVEISKQYYGKPLAVVDYYQALFDYFETGQDSEALHKYMTAQGYLTNEGEYDADKLAGRYELWCSYKAEFNRGMEFYCSSAPEVTVNKNGGLNIKDGLHRTIFLYMQKVTYVPVTMKTENFYRFYDECKLKDIVQFIKDYHITMLCTPIEHPAFYKFPSEKENVEPSVLKAIQQNIGTTDIEDWNILDVSDYNSYFSRIMSKMRTRDGKGYISSVETEPLLYELAKHINNLLQVQNVDLQFVEDVCCLDKKGYRLVFALGKWSGERYSSEMIQWLDEVTEGTLFWECDLAMAKEEKKRIFEETSFREYKVLCQYFDGKQSKQVFALMK